jgi:hypothetical protein
VTATPIPLKACNLAYESCELKEVSGGFFRRRQYLALTGARILLNLPPVVTRSLVLDGEFESWHNRYRRRNAGKRIVVWERRENQRKTSF